MTRNVKYESRDVKLRRGCAGILAALHNTLGDATDGDQFRRADHRCRPVRHQHGLPAEDAVPRQARGTARTAQGDRRHLGPVPLSGCALRFGHVHLRLRVPPVERVEGAGRRRVDPHATSRTRRANTASTKTSTSASRPRRPAGRASTSAGRSRPSTRTAARLAPSPATTWSTAPATTTTTRVTCRAFPASSASRGSAFIRSTGPRSWTTAASASSSSAAAPPR